VLAAPMGRAAKTAVRFRGRAPTRSEILRKITKNE
jgi:hypothetical protein